MCQKRRRCETCETSYFKAQGHRCDASFCQQCTEWYTERPHYCYIKPHNLEKLQEEDAKLKIIVAYDFEAMQIRRGEEIIHEPNLVMAHVSCDRCEGSNVVCDICGDFEIQFSGADCVTSFTDYIYKTLSPLAKKHKARIYALAHNAKGYDAHFIMQDLLTRQDYRNVDLILNGSKILKIDVGNVRFLDSLNFFHQALDKLPKSFNLAELRKGFFPHLFNLPEN